MRRRLLAWAFAIAGCGGGSSPATDAPPSATDAAADAAADPDAGPDAYQGFLIDGLLLDAHFQPLADRLVITTSGASDTTDAQGRFVIPGVTPPYDLAVFEPGSATSPAATVYLGLTRSDPTIVALGFPARASSNLTVNVGGLSGSLVGLDHFALYEADATDGPISSVPSTAELYTSVRWAGSNQLTGRLHLFVQTRDGSTGATTALTRHGATPVHTLTAGTNATQSLTLGGAPAQATISGTASYPAGAATTWLRHYVQLGGGYEQQQGPSHGDGAFSIIVPDLPTTTAAVCAQARDAAGGHAAHCAVELAAGTTGVTLAAPAIPTTTSPAPSASAPVTGPYSWTSPGGVAIVEVLSQASNVPSYFVVTTGTSAQVPDLAALGVTPPGSGAGFVWRAIAYPGFDSVDDAAAGADGFLSGGEVINLIGASHRFAAESVAGASAGSFFTQP